jgi:hypothetical protein
MTVKFMENKRHIFEEVEQNKGLKIFNLPSNVQPPSQPNRLTKSIESIQEPPPLRRINGFGAGLYGVLKDPSLSGIHLKLYFLTALWIPLIPVCAYAVSKINDKFLFHGKISLPTLWRLYRWRIILFYISSLIEGAFLLFFIFIALSITVWICRCIRHLF